MKNDFFAISPPSLNFYHRFFRVLVGIAMMLVAIYTACASILMLIFAALVFSSPKYSPSFEDTLMIVLWVAWVPCAVISLVAGYKSIVTTSHTSRYAFTTICAVINVSAVILYWNRFPSTTSSSNDSLLTGLLLTFISLLYLCSAVAIIVFSRKQPSTTPVNPSAHLLK